MSTSEGRKTGHTGGVAVAVCSAAFLGIAVLGSASGGAVGAEPMLSGPVTRVADGGTLWLGATKVRLCGIDVPRSGQPGYHWATAYLGSLVKDQTVRCVPVGAGTPCDNLPQPAGGDAIIAQCFTGDVDIGAKLIATGHGQPHESSKTETEGSSPHPAPGTTRR